jgi:GDP-4-dehydro-6-deoxy-D-mannose reductase
MKLNKDRKFKKCFITGITGSGGSYLAEHIYKKDKQIKLYGSFRSTGYKKILDSKIKNIDLFKLDLKNYQNVKNKLKKIKPDLIFHLASNADVRGSFDEPIKHTENNNIITVNLLEAIRQLKLKTLIIICSTSEVYGNVSKKHLPITENHPITPINPYAVTKTFQDLMAQVYSKSFNINVIITRMFSYTNARRKNLFQTSFARQIVDIEKAKTNVLKHGNLKSIRTFVDIEDAMEAYWLTAKKGKIGEIYNIGGEKVISVKDFLNTLIKLTQKKINCKPDKKLFRPEDIGIQISDSSKFKRHTGWKPKINFKKSVDKLLNYCRQNY